MRSTISQSCAKNILAPIALALCAPMLCCGCQSQSLPTPEKVPDAFNLQVGDLLFQDLDCGEICDAIEAVTHGFRGANLSHVAMVSQVDGDTPWVIEAYAEGVVEIPLEQMLSRSQDAKGRPKVIVGRLRPDYVSLIHSALQAARERLGMPYDESFLLNNGAYYCSELLYEAFLRANGGRPLFELQPMTFRDPSTGKVLGAWQSYFEKRDQPVPEGEPGLNPGSMSTSPVLSIVHVFGLPEGFSDDHGP